MKKILLAAGLLTLAAAGCSGTSQPPAPEASSGSISAIAVNPSYRIGNRTMYNDGAAIKVTGENLQSVEIKYNPSAADQNGQSLGQAASLSSQQNTWALALPKGFMATNVWAEGRDGQGSIVKSQDLGSVGYEALNGYTSPAKYGFSMQYPESFGFNTDISKVKSLTYIPVCDQTMVACAFLEKSQYPNTNFDGAGVSINIDKTLNTEAKCYNFSVSTNAAQQAAADATINGAVFKSATGGDAGAGHFEKLQVYRNFRNGMCYEIAQHVGSTNIGNYPEGSITEFSQDEVWQRLQMVVNSFAFTEQASAAVPPQAGQKVAIAGTIVCLPHKNTSPDQPQTLECAFGLKDDSTGKYYSLKNANPPVYDTNIRVTAAGTFYNDSQSIYDVAGGIDGAVITKLDK